MQRQNCETLQDRGCCSYAVLEMMLKMEGFLRTAIAVQLLLLATAYQPVLCSLLPSNESSKVAVSFPPAASTSSHPNTDVSPSPASFRADLLSPNQFHPASKSMNSSQDLPLKGFTITSNGSLVSNSGSLLAPASDDGIGITSYSSSLDSPAATPSLETSSTPVPTSSGSSQETEDHERGAMQALVGILLVILAGLIAYGYKLYKKKRRPTDYQRFQGLADGHFNSEDI